MRPGALLDDRWEILAAAPCEALVGRWRAVDRATGEPVEVLALQPPTAHPRATHGRFLDVHRILQRASDPALIPVHAVGWSDAGAWVVRAPLEDRTLADLRPPLPPAVVAALGARLLPAVLAAEGATGSALTARDLGIDAQGRAVLAPRARPADRVGADDARHVAPEALGGRPADAAGGAYGVGVFLYRLATGRFPDPTPARASAWASGIPVALDDALQRLLSREPAERAGALPLLQASAGPLPDLRGLTEGARLVPITAEVGTVKVTTETTAAMSRARVDVPRPRSAVIVPGAVLAGLDPATASLAAGVTGLGVAEVDALARASRPLVLAAYASRYGGAARLAESTRTAALPATVVARPGLVWPLAIGMGGVLLLVVGALAVLAGSAFVGLLWGLLALSLLALGLQWRHQSRRWSEVLASWESQRRADATQPAIQNRRQRVAALRLRLADAQLPEPAASDVRSALGALERHLDDLGRIARTVQDARDAADLDALRSRLAALSGPHADPRRAHERDRLARSVADLEAVQERQARVDADLARVDAALGDLEGVLLDAATRELEDDAAIQALRHTTRLTRDTLTGDSMGRVPPVRERE